VYRAEAEQDFKILRVFFSKKAALSKQALIVKPKIGKRKSKSNEKSMGLA